MKFKKIELEASHLEHTTHNNYANKKTQKKREKAKELGGKSTYQLNNCISIDLIFIHYQDNAFYSCRV